MDELNKLREDILQLQQDILSLQAQLIQQNNENNARFATRTYVQTYIEQIIADLLPIEDAYTEETSFIGYVPLDIERTAKHFERAQQYYNKGDWLYILTAYDNSAEQGSINPYIAVAQMAKETDFGRSFWARRPQRNPAGLGVTGEYSLQDPRTPENRHMWRYNTDRGRWEIGFSFIDWKISAKAHIGHYLRYAYKDTDLSSEQRLLVDQDPRAKAVPVHVHGTVRKLKDLDGNWAYPGIGYGKSIAVLANALRQ